MFSGEALSNESDFSQVSSLAAWMEEVGGGGVILCLNRHVSNRERARRVPKTPPVASPHPPFHSPPPPPALPWHGTLQRGDTYGSPAKEVRARAHARARTSLRNKPRSLPHIHKLPPFFFLFAGIRQESLAKPAEGFFIFLFGFFFTQAGQNITHSTDPRGSSIRP